MGTAFAEVPPPVTTDGPRVVSVRRFGFHARPTSLVVTFNRALLPARAINAGNYLLTDLGPNGAIGRHPQRSIRIVSASYDPVAHAVTLLPEHRLNLHHRFLLRVVGTGSSGLADSKGILLDGAGTGKPGSDYVTSFDRSILAGMPSVLQTGRGHGGVGRPSPAGVDALFGAGSHHARLPSPVRSVSRPRY
ncbi:MAG: hypothetical protein NVSMB9_09900 [Isosphaeraceae bacterium]